MDGFKGFTNPASSNNVTGVLLVRIELKINRAFAALHTADGNVFFFSRELLRGERPRIQTRMRMERDVESRIQTTSFPPFLLHTNF